MVEPLMPGCSATIKLISSSTKISLQYDLEDDCSPSLLPPVSAWLLDIIQSRPDILRYDYWLEIHNSIYEPRHEKTCFGHMRTTKAQSSLCIFTVWSAPLLFIISILAISKISRPWLVFVAEQAGLSLAWTQILQSGFLMTRLIMLLLIWW